MQYEAVNPSLEHISLIKIIVTLWNRDDVRVLIKSFREEMEWKIIESVVIEKVLTLTLPQLLSNKILSLVKPVGLQISKWVKYHCEDYINVDLPKQFCWTPEGILDTKKTAKMLIKDDSINITERYKLACIYCLEDDIKELWDKIPENCKENFYDEKNSLHVNQHDLVVHWTYKIKGKINSAQYKLIGGPFHLYQYVFESAAEECNKAAIEYFLKELPPEEGEELLLRTAIYIAMKLGNYYCMQEHADISCFLFLQMNVNLQARILKIYPYEILRGFLYWPWQSYLWETASLVRDIVSAQLVYNRNILAVKFHDFILLTIITRVMTGYKEINHQEVFREFWQQCSAADKSYIIRRCNIDDLLHQLLCIKDEENVKLIIQDLTFIEKQQLICSSVGRYRWKDIIYADNWRLLNFFIQESFSSEDEAMKFKEGFKKYLKRLCSENELMANKDKWDDFFHWFDNVLYKNDRIKCTEDVHSSPAQRFEENEEG